MFRYTKKILLLFFSCLGVVFLLYNNGVFAETNLSAECEWSNIEKGEKALSQEDYRALLEKCKQYYEQKSVELEGDISKTAKEKKTLSSTIYNLKNKIQNLDYEIYQSSIMIKDLGGQIVNTKASIDKTALKIKDIKASLGNLLQLRYEEDKKTSIEILLAEKTLSGFFDNLVALESLSMQVQKLLENIENLKTNLEEQKQEMDSEKDDLENLVIIRRLQKQENARKQQEKEKFLHLTEQEYQKYLQEQKDAEKKAAIIGNMLFELLEVPEGGIKFEDAVAIAKNISSQTGVRAAFSLAILWQETRVGKLKGGCYLKDVKTGDGVYIKTGNKAPRTMRPTPRAFEKRSNVEDFLSIIKSLNEANKLKTDAFHTPVSCCMVLSNGDYFGWGGAMGPAQFIPSTWLITAPEIEKYTGESPASPWNVRDAFMANSLYLRNLGAGSQTYAKELRAALKYFGCTSYWCQVNYGNPVMKVASCFQTYIEKNQMSSACRNLIF